MSTTKKTETKKTATKEVQKELPETNDFELQLQKAIQLMRDENRDFIEQLDCSVYEASQREEPTTSTCTLTRNDVIKAMLPTIRKEHAKTDAESLAMSIDAICFAFGIES